MSQAPIDVELVVREVLAQLAAAPAEGPGARDEGRGARGEGRETRGQARGTEGLGTSVPSQPRAEPTRDATPFTLTVTARVVTMHDVIGRLDLIRRVVVSPDAVVTPAVRDELLRRGIALEQADSLKNRPVAVRLALMTARTDFDPTMLVAALGREGFRVDRSASDCLIAAVDAMAGEVIKPDTLGVLITPHATAGVCLANRLAGVRAISGIDAPAVAAASAAVGANLLIVDLRSGSFFQLKQAITEFARGGVRSCPDVFRKRLG
jgi:hypothetical protein